MVYLYDESISWAKDCERGWRDERGDGEAAVTGSRDDRLAKHETITVLDDPQLAVNLNGDRCHRAGATYSVSCVLTWVMNSDFGYAVTAAPSA